MESRMRGLTDEGRSTMWISTIGSWTVTSLLGTKVSAGSFASIYVREENEYARVGASDDDVEEVADFKVFP